MENIKLLEALSCLTPNEIDLFGEFISSVYFNKSQIVTKLYAVLRNDYPGFKKLTKEKVFSSIYPGEKLKDKKLRDLFSKMLDLLEDYLAIEDLKNYPLDELGHIMNQYSIRGLDKHFEGLAREMQSLLEKIQVKDSSYFFNSYRLKKDMRSYLEQKKALGKRGEFDPEISSEIDSFILYFIYKMLRYYIEQLNQQKLYKRETKLDFIEQISGYISTRNTESVPQISLLYTCLLMMMKPQEVKHYQALKSLLEINRKYLNKDDLQLIFIQIYNYTRERWYFEGIQEFQSESFDIIKQMIEHDIYPQEHGYMTPQTYINFVSAGLQVKDYEWTTSFMDNYKQHLAPDQSNNTYNYSMALYKYREGQLGDALHYLAETKIEDFYFYLRVKNQTSKIYFEQGEYESLLSLLDTFKHYLSSTKEIPDFIKARFTTYTVYLKKIVTARLAEDEVSVAMIKKEIEAGPVFENKTWILEKV